MRKIGYVLVTISIVASVTFCDLAIANSKPSVTAENKNFIAQAFQEWAEGEGKFFNDVLAPDVVWIIKGTSPAAGTYRGRDEFIKRAVEPFTARLSSLIQPTVNDIWADGNDVIVQWDGTAVAKDGAIYKNSYVWIFRMQDQQAQEVIAFLDLIPYDDVISRIPLEPQ